MARVLIVGCGCRGRGLARSLTEELHAVRGTTRDAANLGLIEETGAEAVVCDPNRLATLTPHLAGVSALCWLMGTVEREAADALHGPRLESLLEAIVDSPVRGFVYEGVAGVEAVKRAGETYRMPVAVIDADPGDHEAWLADAKAAILEVLS